MLRKFIIFLLILCLSGILPLCAMADDIKAEPDAQQVRIPLVFDLSDVIAGAQFTFSYTDGLSFVEYEQSDAVQSGVLTPVAEKNDGTTLGFFSADNIFVPQDGKLDVGCLVFDYVGQAQQSVTVSEIKLVWVADNGTTDSKLLEPVAITISRESIDTGSSGANPPANSENPGSPGESPPANSENSDGDFSLWWIIAAVVLVAVVVLIIVLIRKKKKVVGPSNTSDEELM